MDLKIPDRHMKYPYTWTAKLVQFPYKFQFQSSYAFRYFWYATGVTLAIYWQINKLIKTPENKEFTAKKRAEELHYHYKSL